MFLWFFVVINYFLDCKYYKKIKILMLKYFIMVGKNSKTVVFLNKQPFVYETVFG